MKKLTKLPLIQLLGLMAHQVLKGVEQKICYFLSLIIQKPFRSKELLAL